MTWQIWDEHRDHGQARAGSLWRGWSARVKVEHAAWPQATMTGLGLLLALGGVWGLHGQGGRASSAASRVWTQAQPLTHLQAVAIGILSWCAAVLVVSTCFLGLMLLAAWVQQRHSRRRSAAAMGPCLDAINSEDASGMRRLRQAVSHTHEETRSIG
jgi:hypothetical protein